MGWARARPLVGAWGSKATLTLCMHQPLEAGQQACDRFSVASHAAVLLYRMLIVTVSGQMEAGAVRLTNRATAKPRIKVAVSHSATVIDSSCCSTSIVEVQFSRNKR